MISAAMGALDDLSDNALYMAYIPLLLTNLLVAVAYGHWALVLYRDRTPMLRHLVAGIGLQFFVGFFEQSCVAYYRFLGDYRDWGHNYPLLLAIKLGYMLAGGLHIYGYLTASGRRKWFWRVLFALPALLALEAVLGIGVSGDPSQHWHR